MTVTVLCSPHGPQSLESASGGPFSGCCNPWPVAYFGRSTGSMCHPENCSTGRIHCSDKAPAIGQVLGQLPSVDAAKAGDELWLEIKEIAAVLAKFALDRSCAQWQTQLAKLFAAMR